MTKGKVYLVGAGPGDEGLITVKGLECIKEAELIVYDNLINVSLLSRAQETAEKIYVGKKEGAHTLPQEEINRLLVEKAKEGKKVVRLKGGDPFIFGRGGEEAETLFEAGIEVEIVPGVTSAIAAPAYAGIPLTHRRVTSTLGFITGHQDPTKGESDVAWEKISTGLGTLVFLMGVRNLPEIVKQLLSYGRSKDTPVAVIRQGTLPGQETVVGTLSSIIEEVEKKKIKPPAVIVVGEVVRFREKLKWFENKPLLGKRIVVTRARAQASKLSRRLRAEGAQVIEFPTIEISPPQDYGDLDDAIRNIGDYQWIIFTSPNGVEYFLKRLRKKGKDLRSLAPCRIGAIGEVTAKTLSDYGINPDFVPREYSSEGIGKEFPEKDLSGQRLLIPRAEEAPQELPRALAGRGAEVKVVTAYRTVKVKSPLSTCLNHDAIDLITFTSSSTVKNLVGMLDKGKLIQLKEKTRVAAIGPVTARTAREEGFEVAIMPEEYTIDALVEAVVDYYKK
ncbi:MAG: uroporphyrinogen-III C-methyltransferase [Nitrospirae bacterium]|nr:uroporphyrinogen-III C-methyltransferase [Nitrospirota bacterium]